MKFMNLLKVSLIICLVLACDVFHQEDPREVKNHKTVFVLDEDTIDIESLKLVELKNDTIPFATKISIRKKDLLSLVNKIIDSNSEKELINADLYVKAPSKDSITNWTVTLDDVRKISYYYVENNRIKLAYYDLYNNDRKFFSGLSNAHCGIPSMFLHRDIEKGEKLALLGLKLDISDLPDKNDLIFSSKKEDTLYQSQKLYFK